MPDCLSHKWIKIKFYFVNFFVNWTIGHSLKQEGYIWGKDISCVNMNSWIWNQLTASCAPSSGNPWKMCWHEQFFFCSLLFGFNYLACRSYIRESRARTRSDSVRKERFKIMHCVQIWWIWVYQYPGVWWEGFVFAYLCICVFVCLSVWVYQYPGVWSEGSVFVEDLATGGPCSPPQPDMGPYSNLFFVI